MLLLLFSKDGFLTLTLRDELLKYELLLLFFEFKDGVRDELNALGCEIDDDEHFNAALHVRNLLYLMFLSRKIAL
jgi:hypothetical protein